ncbi:MAG TPA: hypothetical protein VJM08_05890 [Anaerolineales bacterium]|nr:hypothetical protein [Anaerolineales bacterium]
MSELLQITNFQSQLDQIFSIHLDDARTIDLQLVSVTELGTASQTRIRTPFSLHFLGPVSQQYLLLHTYPMVNETLGTLDIFIVPLGAEAGRMRYEAIFT